MDSIKSENIEGIYIEEEELSKRIKDSKDVVVDKVVEQEYILEEEKSQKENKDFIKEDESVKPLKSIEEMTADELEEFLAPEIKRRQEMSDY